MESPVVVVLTALDVEDRAFRPHLTDLRVTRHPKGTFFEMATVPGIAAQVVLATTGEGVVKAGVIAERAIAEFSPAAMLFVGIAGALADDLALGDVVIATRIYAYHGGREEQDGFHSRPRSWEADHRLEQFARTVERTGNWHKFLTSDDQLPAVHFRPIAAGEVVLNASCAPLLDLLNRHFNDAAAIETESAGAAQAAHLNLGVPMIAVRGISDHASGEKDSTDKAGWREAAAQNAAAFALALICELDMQADEPSATAVNSGNTNAGATPSLTINGDGNVLHQGSRIDAGIVVCRDWQQGGRA